MEYSVISVHPGVQGGGARRELLPVLEQHEMSPFAPGSHEDAPCTPSQSQGAEQPDAGAWDLMQPPFYAGRQDPATASWRRDLTTGGGIGRWMPGEQFRRGTLTTFCLILLCSLGLERPSIKQGVPRLGCTPPPR
jgi:hypothetical protein